MADTKLTGLTENTSPATTDLVYVVADPGSTPVSRKVQIANLAATIRSLGGRVLISEQTPTGTSVTFAAIPGTYRSLELEWAARSDRASNASENLVMSFNADTTDANYRYAFMAATDTTLAGSSADGRLIGQVTGATATANMAGSGVCRLPNYAGTTFFKQAITSCFVRRGATDQQVFEWCLDWENTAAITQIVISTANSSNFIAGSTFRLWGIS